jgi:hypothetical protein
MRAFLKQEQPVRDLLPSICAENPSVTVALSYRVYAILYFMDSPQPPERCWTKNIGNRKDSSRNSATGETRGRNSNAKTNRYRLAPIIRRDSDYRQAVDRETSGSPLPH